MTACLSPSQPVRQFLLLFLLAAFITLFLSTLAVCKTVTHAAHGYYQMTAMHRFITQLGVVTVDTLIAAALKVLFELAFALTQGCTL